MTTPTLDPGGMDKYRAFEDDDTPPVLDSINRVTEKTALYNLKYQAHCLAELRSGGSKDGTITQLHLQVWRLERDLLTRETPNKARQYDPSFQFDTICAVIGSKLRLPSVQVAGYLQDVEWALTYNDLTR